MQENEIIDDRFTVKAKLGNGANGTVYLAFDDRNKRYCALKKINVDDDFQQRYANREIKILQKLKGQKNIVQLYSVKRNKNDRVEYFVEEYICGTDLYKKYEQRIIFSELESCKIIRDIAGVLLVLEREHIVHRDINLSNIMVDKTGNIKLIDFGIARDNDSETAKKRTYVTACLGTPYTKAPEQYGLEEKKIDSRTDVYALGKTWLMLLTGQNTDNPQVMNSFCNGLQKVLLKMIKEKKEERYQTITELNGDLDDLIKSGTLHKSQFQKSLTR